MMLSRVADNLYWMSRYIERAENTARLLDVYLNLILDMPTGIHPHSQQLNLLESINMDTTGMNGQDTEDFQSTVYNLTFDESNGHSVMSGIAAARENARQVRDAISSEMWLHLNRCYLALKNGDRASVYAVEPHDVYMAIKLDSHLFQGITDATMYHNEGWHFIQLGRNIERIINLVSVLTVYIQHPGIEAANNSQPANYFRMLTLLKSVTAWEAYCKEHTPELDDTSILEFLLFNAQFPRSAHFCVDAILYSIKQISTVTHSRKNSRLSRLIGRLQSNLSYDEITDVLETDFRTYLHNVRSHIYQINDLLHSTFITYAIEDALE